MKFSLLFIGSFLAVGCATGVVPDDPEPAPTPKKDAGSTADAKGPAQQQDSGVSNPDTGVEDPGTDSGVNNNCMLMINYGTNTCQTCMQGCCAQDNACANAQDCVDLITCLNGCSPSDQTCVQGCRTQHASGSSLFDGITSCMGQVCKSSCP